MTSSLARWQRADGRRSRGQRLVLVLNALLVSVSLGAAVALSYALDRASDVNRVALDRSLADLTEDDSGDRVVNILLVGSDSSADLDPDDPIQNGRHGEHFGDVIIIAHLDERSGDAALLSLPRDLWVPIAGTGGDGRINHAFVVGGPATLIDTIEETFGIPIHHYINVDFAGFQGLVEAVGSVPVHFERPARDWNVDASPGPRSQTGFLVTEPGCHDLGPEQALAYVRSRYYQTQAPDGSWHTDPTSDLGRIRRQQDFLRALLKRAIELGARNPLVLADLVDTGIEHVAIDHQLTPAMMIDLSATFRDFEPGELQTFTFPATDHTVESRRVLLPGDGPAAEALTELFGGDRFDSLDTIGLQLVHDDHASSVVASAVAERLVGAGFAVTDPAEAEVSPGVWIRHGPGGQQAAEVVAGALEAGAEPVSARAPVRIGQVDDLPGRIVEVAVGPVAPAGPAVDRFDGAPSPSLDVPADPSAGAIGHIPSGLLPGQSSPPLPPLPESEHNGRLGQASIREGGCG